MTFRFIQFWFIGLLSLIVPHSIFALEAPSINAIQLEQSDQPYQITNQLTYLVDPDGTLSAERVFEGKGLDWQRNPDSKPSFGITDVVYWWRIQVTNRIDFDEWLLVIGYPLLDKIDVYIRQNGLQKPPNPIKFGDNYPFNDRSTPHRLFLQDLKIKKGQTFTLYIRIESQSPIQGPLEIWSKTAFFTADQYITIGQGFYYGGMLIMALFNLIIFLVVRDISYFYYVSCVFFQALFQAAINGYGFQYLWPMSPEFQQVSTVLALNLSIAYAALFFNRLLDLKKRNPAAYKFILAFAIFLFIKSVLIFFIPYIWAVRTSVVTIAIMAMFSVYIALPMSLQNIAEARLFMLGWGVMILGGVVLAMNKLGILPQNAFTQNSFQLGSLIEVVLLSLAMANQINKERKKRYLAQEHALKVQRSANENLERKVHERTSELEFLNAKLDQLSKTDALTGVLNRRAFDELYEQETNYCRLHKTPLAMLILDIDYFKRINDDYGHESGDECLRVVGRILKELCTEEHVYVTRYGGEEFVVSMRGVTKDAAVDRAELIRQRVEKTSFDAYGETLSATMSIGVATGVPSVNDVVGLLHHADQALYEAKNNGRNQVQVAKF